MSAGSGSEAPKLAEARALLRVARATSHIDANTRNLSPGSISLQHLCGEPIAGKPGRRHSFSTFMLCNQAPDVVRTIAAQLAKEPSFATNPQGAGALCEDLAKIDSAGRSALLFSEEEDEGGLPGHVSIRFAHHVIGAGRAEQRVVRGALIAVFGTVTGVDDVRSAKCP